MNIKDYFNKSSMKKPVITDEAKKRLKKHRDVDE